MNVQMYLPQLPFANVIFRKRTASMGATVLLAPSEGNPTEVAAHVLSLQGPVGQRPSLRIFLAIQKYLPGSNGTFWAMDANFRTGWLGELLTMFLVGSLVVAGWSRRVKWPW